MGKSASPRELAVQSFSRPAAGCCTYCMYDARPCWHNRLVLCVVSLLLLRPPIHPTATAKVPTSPISPYDITNQLPSETEIQNSAWPRFVMFLSKPATPRRTGTTPPVHLPVRNECTHACTRAPRPPSASQPSWSGFWIWGARWVLVLVWFWFWSDSAEPVPPTDPRHTGFWRVCECRCWMVGEH
ncbi:hypothetical protein AOQ84DRAFT_147701 [Glonium stellatum]|uniref:Uncharacterized protein n=1 Tax=Glonium stellatum TaxID=574774 RepID=A0A8E2JZ34_9PEZI|nr:hypothetical protein AOQ84DRAFT_147701 [Glonium stellatum]